MSASYLGHLEPCLREVLQPVGRGVGHICEDNVEGIGLLGNGDVQDGAVSLLGVLEPKIEFSDPINTQISRILVLIKFDTDLKWCRAICPVEHTCLLWEDFECSKFFALGLNHVDCLEGTIDHKESWLEADQLGEAEWLRKERDD